MGPNHDAGVGGLADIPFGNCRSIASPVYNEIDNLFALLRCHFGETSAFCSDHVPEPITCDGSMICREIFWMAFNLRHDPDL
ncbi:hypothetical protein EFQ99_16885 [Rhizobium vallis]|uniref:Uncharacterized protein n=1 Tax=Rhizobium vallis TaxID=634290 RepID=A0A432PJG0_9HYPH|nr:hypothetical protein EFQ99_16885 [Rhizobium vallis]